MKTSALLTLTLVVSLAGCGAIRDSKVNPFNWFGKSRAEKTTTVVVDPNARDDGRVLVDQVTSMRVNRTPAGAVVEVIGLPPTQGYWEADIFALNDGYPVEGVLTYEFRVAKPIVQSRQGTPTSREITAGIAISNARLQGVRSIRVVGARTSRTARR